MKVRKKSKKKSSEETWKPAREQLRDWRNAQLPKLTQLAAAQVLRVTPNFIGNLERGERMPGLVLANLVMEITGIKQKHWEEPPTA